MARARPRMEGMPLLEIMLVVVIIAIGATGMGYSLGSLTRANLKAGAGKLAAAVRYAYNRAITQGSTVRIVFDLPGKTFSIEEAQGRMMLARKDDERRFGEDGEDRGAAVDPWEAAKAALEEGVKPSLGESPFSPISGKASRYTNVALGRGIHLVKLYVPHEEDPKDEGKGAIHFFPGGYTEHAVLHLSDGHEGFYSVEIHPLTGRCRVRPEAYEPEAFLDDPDERDFSEVDE